MAARDLGGGGGRRRAVTRACGLSARGKARPISPAPSSPTLDAPGQVERQRDDDPVAAEAVADRGAVQWGDHEPADQDRRRPEPEAEQPGRCDRQARQGEAEDQPPDPAPERQIRHQRHVQRPRGLHRIGRRHHPRQMQQRPDPLVDDQDAEHPGDEAETRTLHCRHGRSSFQHDGSTAEAGCSSFRPTPVEPQPPHLRRAARAAWPPRPPIGSPSGRMLEMQLRSASVRPRRGCPGEIGAEAVRRGQPGPLADQHHRRVGAAEPRRSRRRAPRAPGCRDHDRRDLRRSAAQRRREQRHGVALHRGRRQAVADHEQQSRRRGRAAARRGPPRRSRRPRSGRRR